MGFHLFFFFFLKWEFFCVNEKNIQNICINKYMKRIKYEKYGFLLREQIFNLMTFNTFWSLNDVIFANEDIIYNNLMISARQKEEMKYFMI